MALLDRVSTLIRANLNDLVDRAENPEKMLKQVILDMENQFMQVKTQVAIALADLHLLEKKKKENAEKHTDWMHKAELAVDKQDDELARAALERAMSFQQLADSFDQQIADQEVQVEALKSALKKLELKLSEANGKADLLIAQHRRSRAVSRAADAQLTPTARTAPSIACGRRSLAKRHWVVPRTRCWATISKAGCTPSIANRRSTHCWRKSRPRSGGECVVAAELDYANERMTSYPTLELFLRARGFARGICFLLGSRQSQISRFPT